MMKENFSKLKIAITGGIGSGKSQAANFIKDLGFPVFSCDEIYKEVIATPKYIEEIQKFFPQCVIDNQIDRKILGKIIFNDEASRKIVNQIAHPLILNQLFKNLEREPSKLVFAEVPLLFESGHEKYFDIVFIIQRELPKRIESVKGRDGLSETEILARIQSQFDYTKIEKMNLQNKKQFFIIENNTSKEDLKLSLIQAINKLQ